MTEHEAIRAIQTWYPQIYLACHRDHKRSRNTRSGISPRESSILAHLNERVPVTVTQLAKHLGIGAPSMSAALKRLTGLGFVTCETADTDARRRDVRLTRAGARAMADSSVLETIRVKALLRRLAPDERAQALAGLALLARAARQVGAGTRT